jgi:hypothetical protein
MYDRGAERLATFGAINLIGFNSPSFSPLGNEVQTREKPDLWVSNI